MARRYLSGFLGDLSAVVDPESSQNKPAKKLRVEHFEHPHGNFVKLFLDTANLAAEEVSVRRSGTNLLIDVVPEFADGLACSSDTLRNTRLSQEQLKIRYEKYQHLTWSKSSANEISDFFRDIVLQKSEKGHELGGWEFRSIGMANTIVEALVSLRDSGIAPLNAEQFRHHLQLDALVSIWLSNNLCPTAQEKLRSYLTNLPAFNVEDAIAGSIHPKCYELHGYSTMMFYEEVESMIHSEQAKLRTFRSEPEHHEYTIKAPFKKVEYAISTEGLTVTVFYHPNEEKCLMGRP